MSYEGYSERLCSDGHYAAFDAYEDVSKSCDVCGKPWAYWHGVDVTNGYEEGIPGCCDAPKTIAHKDDVWHQDHHGNRYATISYRYEPGPHWSKLKQPSS